VRVAACGRDPYAARRVDDPAGLGQVGNHDIVFHGGDAPQPDFVQDEPRLVSELGHESKSYRWTCG
jgi:hypothetical protein